MKNKGAIFVKPIWIILAIAGFFLVGMLLQNRYDVFSITGNELMSRTTVSQVKPNEQFQLNYEVLGATGSWAVSIIDSVSGGCTFPNGKTTYQDVIVSDSGKTRTVTITAPSTSATCTFTGDYKFGTTATKSFTGTTVSVKSCNTDSDTNCDGSIDRTELGVAISQWINNEISRDKLGEVIMAWVG